MTIIYSLFDEMINQSTHGQSYQGPNSTSNLICLRIFVFFTSQMTLICSSVHIYVGILKF